MHFYVETSCQSNLLWYKSADIEQFKEDAIIDASKIRNIEHLENGKNICWWGLERLVVEGSKTMRARQQVKQVVLYKQVEAHQDKRFIEASYRIRVERKGQAIHSR